MHLISGRRPGKNMQQKISLKLLPAQAADDIEIQKNIAAYLNKQKSAVKGFTIIKKSIDARGQKVYINLTVNAFIDEPFEEKSQANWKFQDVTHATKSVIIIGSVC